MGRIGKVDRTITGEAQHQASSLMTIHLPKITQVGIELPAGLPVA